MPKATYDPAVIQKFADKLYSEAKTTVLISTVIGITVGAGTGIGTGHVPVAIVAAGLFGIFGFVIGRLRAFSLKLQAQVALCQKQIEENTRAVALMGSYDEHSASVV